MSNYIINNPQDLKSFILSTTIRLRKKKMPLCANMCAGALVDRHILVCDRIFM